MRIISLVPSLTELLYDLGLDDEVVGITKFCVHPAHWHQQKTKVGGTKNIHPDIIDQLQPTLIIANKEENVKEQVLLLQEKYPVLLTDIHSIATALEAIPEIGRVVGKAEQAGKLVQSIRQGFADLTMLQPMQRALYLIWKDPYMSIGADTYIHDVLSHIGFYNVCAAHTRYPSLTVAQLQMLQPAYILLSSEPYPFSEKHFDMIRAICPDAKLLLVDGEMFSWYGSRMLQAPGYFGQLQERLRH